MAASEQLADPGAHGTCKLQMALAGGKLHLGMTRAAASEDVKSPAALGTAQTADTKASDAAQPEASMETDAGATGQESVTIAGQSFPNRNTVQVHVRTLQESLSDNQPLLPEDALFMFHLASFLPEFESKLSAPVVGFKYAPFNQASVLKCFFMLRSDGTEESISVKKCLDALYATFAPKLPAGKKRPREAEGPDGDAPGQKKAFKMRPGCVVLITGIPANVPYQIVRTKLESMAPTGDCRFVELLEVKPKKKKKGKGKGKDKGKVGKADEDESESEPDDPNAEPNSARARFADADVTAKVAKELNQINGHVVKTRILGGDEEKAFWEQLLERADKRRGEEASGKKGKGKGKKK